MPNTSSYLLKYLTIQHHHQLTPCDVIQLNVGGVDRGIHGILVQIRDDDLKVVPNVRVEDMGHKMGLNGVDNAKLFFDNVRVPRENLLNRFGKSPQIKLLFKVEKISDIQMLKKAANLRRQSRLIERDSSQLLTSCYQVTHNHPQLSLD